MNVSIYFNEQYESVFPSQFGRISREPDKTFDQIGDSFSYQEHVDFLGKYGAKLGHKSLGEHTILHVGFMDISETLAKFIENQRYSAYPTQKSTRFVSFKLKELYKKLSNTVDFEEIFQIVDTVFDIKRVFDLLESESLKNKLLDYYVSLIKYYNETYNEVREHYENTFRKLPQLKIDSDFIFETKCLDMARAFLAVNTKTDVGMTYTLNGFINLLYNLIDFDTRESRELCDLLISKLPKENSVFTEYLAKIEKYKEKYKNYINKIRDINDARNSAHAAFLPNIVALDKEKILNTLKAEVQVRTEKEVLTKFSLFKMDFKAFPVLLDVLIDSCDEENKSILDDEYHHFLRKMEHMMQFSIETNIDFGTFRDIQRHRTASNLYSNYTSPFVDIGANMGLVYHIPTVDMCLMKDSMSQESFEKIGISQDIFDIRHQNVLSGISERLRDVGFRYSTFMYALYQEWLPDINKEKMTDFIEISSNINIFAYNTRAETMMDLRTLVHIANTRSTFPHGHNTYVRYAIELRKALMMYLEEYAEQTGMEDADIDKLDKILFRNFHKNTEKMKLI